MQTLLLEADQKLLRREGTVLKKEVYKCLATTNSRTSLKRKSGRVGGKWSLLPRGRGPHLEDTDAERSWEQVGIFQSKWSVQEGGGQDRGKDLCRTGGEE